MGFSPCWALCANNAEVLRDVALKGGGVALLPNFVAEHALQRRRAAAAFLTDYVSSPPTALYAVYPPTRQLAVKVRVFIDFLVERFSTR